MRRAGSHRVGISFKILGGRFPGSEGGLAQLWRVSYLRVIMNDFTGIFFFFSVIVTADEEEKGRWKSAS